MLSMPAATRSGTPGLHRDVRLKMVSESMITYDITLFFHQKLSDIRSEYMRLNGDQVLESDRPGEDQIQQLVQIAQPLLIFAANVCRLLSEPDEDLQDSLKIVVDHRFDASELSGPYFPVLGHVLLEQTKQQREKTTMELEESSQPRNSRK